MSPKKTEYTKVKVGGRTLRVAKTLSPATNAARGYCQNCSGNGNIPAPGKPKPDVCRPCNGTGRA